MLQRYLFLFFTTCLFGNAFSQNNTRTNKARSGATILVNLKDLTPAEKVHFSTKYMSYILRKINKRATKIVLPGETLSSIIDSTYGLKITDPSFTRYTSEVAFLNNIADVDHIETGQSLILPAAEFRPAMATHFDIPIEFDPVNATLTPRTKQDLDMVRSFVSINPGFTVAVKGNTPALNPDMPSIQQKTGVLRNYLAGSWKVPTKDLQVSLSTDAEYDMDYIHLEGIKLSNLYGIDNSSRHTWIGSPHLDYQLKDMRSANLVIDVTGDELKKILTDEDSGFFFSLLNRNKLAICSNEDLLANIYLRDTVVKSNQYVENSPSDLQFDLSGLDTADFRNFYVLDIFRKDTCTHGTKVLEVVKELLDKYKLSKAMVKVKPIPINYFNNRDTCDVIYRQWQGMRGVSRLTRGANGTQSAVNESTWEINAGDDRVTPEGYLGALNTVLINQSPDIISSSFVVGCSADILTPVITSPTVIECTNFIASAANDSNVIEKYRYPIPGPGGALDEYNEPLLSYMKSRPQVGTIIVGNETTDSTFKGNYSQGGEFVTTLGKGVGWGDSTTCIKDTQSGTSFAAPEVATKLFIAKAWWRKYKVQVNSMEARKRLILSTDLKPCFIGKFASGGPVDLNKLLQLKGAYLVDLNNKVIPVDTVNMSSIDYLSFDNKKGVLKSNLQQDNSDQIRGVCWVGGHFFIFDNESEKWVEIKEVTRLNISCFIDGRNEPVYTNDFGTKYKQIVILNKGKK